MSNYSLFINYHIYLLKYFIFVTFFAIFISGCSGKRYYFYEGSPQSSAKVATVVLYGKLYLTSLNNIPLSETFAFSAPHTFDVSPGEYALDLFYTDVGEVNNKRIITRGRDTILLHAQPGHIYYMYPLIERKIRKFEIKVVDFEKLDDLSGYSKGFWDTSRDDGQLIKKRVELHYQEKQSHSFRVSERNHWE